MEGAGSKKVIKAIKRVKSNPERNALGMNPKQEDGWTILAITVIIFILIQIII